MNNALFTSKTGLWETPQEFFDKLNREFDFTFPSMVCVFLGGTQDD